MAQLRLGNGYFTGWLGRANLVYAAFWLGKAAAHGNAEAKTALAAVERQKAFDAQARKFAAQPADPPAADELSAAIQKDPANPRLYRKRSAAYLFAGIDEKALADADKVVELNPNDDDGHFLRYFALVFLGRAEEAAAAKARGLALKPSKAGKLDQELEELKKHRSAAAQPAKK